MTECEELREAYLRLRRAAERVVDGAVAVGDAEQPLCGVAPHLVRTLRRELRAEPQPTGMWMSIS